MRWLTFASTPACRPRSFLVGVEWGDVGGKAVYFGRVKDSGGGVEGVEKNREVLSFNIC